MTSDAAATEKIPVICISKSGWESAKVFNPNLWEPRSKGIIQSCWAELTVLRHCVGEICELCRDSEKLCAPQIEGLRVQWATAKFDLARAAFFVEQPSLHLRIEAFFAGVKSLLDLLVQLLSRERIVGSGIHGFHKAGDVYGGTVLNALHRNARRDQKALAENFRALLLNHKKAWIDEVIAGRDYLVHPQGGLSQLMFHLECVEKDGTFLCSKVQPPSVNSIPIDQYAKTILGQATAFAEAFVGLFGRASLK